MDDRFEDRYRMEMGSARTSLERVGDHAFRTDPNQSYTEAPYEDIYEDAIYGGRADPEADQEFFVYSIDWGEEKPDAESIEALGEELNQVFEGWIIDEGGNRVFALRPPEESRSEP
jgi:hypothetical protein